MECNKQEAIRAKEIAERKLVEKDFESAKIFSLKAQQIFPDLENISQLLSVCEVHCAAAVKVNGLPDWYRILQVEPTADELSIKKQYRKLALSLHPDKNKLAGAEAAFKLIGEAHITLSDKEKRSTYDVRRKAFVNSSAQKPQSQPVNPKFHGSVQPGVPPFFHSFDPKFSGAQTFWSKCHHCQMMNRVSCTNLNRVSNCQQCGKTFVAYDVFKPGTVPDYVPKHSAPGVSPPNWFSPQNAFKAANFSKTGFSGQDTIKTAQEKPFETSSSGTGTFPRNFSRATHGCQNAAKFSATGLNGNMGGGAEHYKKKHRVSVEHTKQEEPVNNAPSKQPKAKSEGVKFANVKRREPAEKSFKNQKTHRKRKIAELSEDEFSDTESSDSDVTHTPDMDSVGNECRRRSSRQKRDVRYADLSDDDNDDVSSLPKRSTVDTHHDSNKNAGLSDNDDISNIDTAYKGLNTEMSSDEPPKQSSDGLQEDRNKEEPGITPRDHVSPVHSGPSTLTYPDPEFYDFDHDRDASVFTRGQIWATYDDLDGMPRFYAKITRVISSMKVRFTWLEPTLGTQAEIDWADACLPVACGNFRLGATETTDSWAMFSHLMPCKKGENRNSYIVRPGKGEIWAMYKNWDISWSSDSEDRKSFEYEIVEILLDNTSAIHIKMLFKVEDFVSVFACNLDAESISIPSSEILRFSHMIPSYKIPIPEAESESGVCYELDPAALPSNSEHKFPSFILGIRLAHGLKQMKEKCSKHAAARHVESPASHCTSDKSTTENEWLYNFESEKSYAKLAVGQIWALNCDIDSFPRYYAYICTVDDAGPKVTVRWMDYNGDLVSISPWLYNALPIACGKFKFSTCKGCREMLCTLENFSHLVQFEPDKSHQYNIYPHVGEVWALYKNWSIEWEDSDLKGCAYDVVEVLGVGSVTKVAVLVKVNGSTNAIFTRKTEKGSEVTADIPESEILRFSHRVPSHHLVRGPWKGYWQLDQLCVPPNLL